VPLRWWILIGVFLLSGITVFSLTAFERFSLVESELIMDSAFLQNDRHWTVRGGSSVSFISPNIEMINAENSNGEVEQDLEIGGPG